MRIARSNACFSSCSIAIQQLVAIARAVDISAKVLILDEPTSSLDADEVKQLFAIMQKLKGSGLGIIFVTHFLDQVYAVADRITVLRNGQLVGEYEAGALPRLQLISRMMGKELAEFEMQTITRDARTRDPFLELLHRLLVAAPDLCVDRSEVGLLRADVRRKRERGGGCRRILDKGAAIDHWDLWRESGLRCASYSAFLEEGYASALKS